MVLTYESPLVTCSLAVSVVVPIPTLVCAAKTSVWRQARGGVFTLPD